MAKVKHEDTGRKILFNKKDQYIKLKKIQDLDVSEVLKISKKDFLSKIENDFDYFYQNDFSPKGIAVLYNFFKRINISPFSGTKSEKKNLIENGLIADVLSKKYSSEFYVKFMACLYLLSGEMLKEKLYSIPLTSDETGLCLENLKKGLEQDSNFDFYNANHLYHLENKSLNMVLDDLSQGKNNKNEQPSALKQGLLTYLSKYQDIINNFSNEDIAYIATKSLGRVADFQFLDKKAYCDWAIFTNEVDFKVKANRNKEKAYKEFSLEKKNENSVKNNSKNNVENAIEAKEIDKEDEDVFNLVKEMKTALASLKKGKIAFSFLQEFKLFERNLEPKYKEVEREGYDYLKDLSKQGKIVDTELLMDEFNFSAFYFGNYVSNKDRQLLLNHSYEGFLDLAKFLNIEQKGIGLAIPNEDTLVLGFGTQGNKSAAAHYSPQQHFIHLTKKNGTGALAHEYFHAIDHYLFEKANAKGLIPHEILVGKKMLSEVIGQIVKYHYGYKTTVRIDDRVMTKLEEDAQFAKIKKEFPEFTSLVLTLYQQNEIDLKEKNDLKNEIFLESQQMVSALFKHAENSYKHEISSLVEMKIENVLQDNYLNERFIKRNENFLLMLQDIVEEISDKDEATLEDIVKFIKDDLNFNKVISFINEESKTYNDKDDNQNYHNKISQSVVDYVESKFKDEKISALIESDIAKCLEKAKREGNTIYLKEIQQYVKNTSNLMKTMRTLIDVEDFNDSSHDVVRERSFMGKNFASLINRNEIFVKKKFSELASNIVVNIIVENLLNKNIAVKQVEQVHPILTRCLILDENLKREYYSTPCEMFARIGESIIGREVKNTFLCNLNDKIAVNYVVNRANPYLLDNEVKDGKMKDLFLKTIKREFKNDFNYQKVEDVVFESDLNQNEQKEIKTYSQQLSLF